MPVDKTTRNNSIDFIKGVAIVAVVLYHFGGNVLPYGYLGVDIFFVVGGYLLFKGLNNQFARQTFNYWQFIFRKLVRLWPLIFVVSAVSMLLGYFLMLPDDFENLAESVVASSVFSNNILQCITTKNYWDIVNLYKPLMHLWYIGVLMQAYIVIPLIVLLVRKFLRGGVKQTALGLTIISLLFFISPWFTDAQKFYYLPFRFFEITMGGIPLFWKSSFKLQTAKLISLLSFISLLLFLCLHMELVSAKVLLILTCFCTLFFIISTENIQYKTFNNFVKFGADIGKSSYSIYLWHQVVVAFLFYSFFPVQSKTSFLIFIALVCILSFLSYKYIETPLGLAVTNKKRELIVLLTTAIGTTFICAYSLVVFCHAGVVRDVEELDVFKNTVHRGQHAEYCDRPYQWNKDFDDNSKIKVLVIGNSFGRDWANILYEWDVQKQLQISYLYADGSVINNLERLKKADLVFYADGPGFKEIPNILKDSVSKEKLYIIGNKNYGASNGIIYALRNYKDYYESSVPISGKLLRSNKKNAKEYGSHFIDLMMPVMADSARVKVFTDDHKYISQDCRHLTQAGARFYARILDIEGIIGRH